MVGRKENWITIERKMRRGDGQGRDSDRTKIRVVGRHGRKPRAKKKRGRRVDYAVKGLRDRRDHFLEFPSHTKAYKLYNLSSVFTHSTKAGRTSDGPGH